MKKTKNGGLERKSLTISQLIKELNVFLADPDIGDVEIFTTTGDHPIFDGVTKSFVMKSAKDDKTVLVLLANGDILRV